MLPHAFFDWWFAPWAYAVDATPELPMPADWLGQRDGYRRWCNRMRVSANFPETFDPSWHVAAIDSGAELTAAARLFAGLIAAREHNQPVLAELPFADRKWCVSIAATQPLRGCGDIAYTANDMIEVRGLVELAHRLEQNFPGLWSRLRLMLAAPLAARVDSLLETVRAVAKESETAAMRVQRCWMLCRSRASETSTQSASASPDDSTDVNESAEHADDDAVAMP